MSGWEMAYMPVASTLLSSAEHLFADCYVCAYCIPPTVFQKVIKVALLSSFEYFFLREKIEIHFAAMLLVLDESCFQVIWAATISCDL